MIRKTVLLAGVAGAMLMAAPALAQDPMASPQTAPAPAPSTMPAPAPQTAPAAPAASASGTLTLQPGANVKGSDGSVLGKLEGVQAGASGEQELTVRGTDGQLRGVPLAGLTQQGADVVVGWSAAEYQAAPPVAGSTPASPATPSPAAPAPGAMPPAPPTMPMADPATSPDPMTPDEGAMSDDEAMSDDSMAPAPTEPEA